MKVLFKMNDPPYGTEPSYNGWRDRDGVGSTVPNRISVERSNNIPAIQETYGDGR
ncbi:MAG: hypothetical protein BMS9Abin01_2246 [Gammaproteobacteria bacterium]|nr:MAG: hypothetical protein BMS9Abin01_2246 [Gammaproteobacteria bacterium]